MVPGTLAQSSKFEDWCSKCNLRPISKEYGDESITIAEGRWTGREISRHNRKLFNGTLPNEKTDHWVVMYGIQLGPKMEMCVPILFSVNDCLNKDINAEDRRRLALLRAFEAKELLRNARNPQ